MTLRINYAYELESETRKKIHDIRSEFDEQFGDKIYYTAQDKQIAMDILDYYSNIIDSSQCIEYLTDTLMYLERTYKDLFLN